MARTYLLSAVGRNGDRKAGRKKTTERTACAMISSLKSLYNREIVPYNNFLIQNMFTASAKTDEV